MAHKLNDIILSRYPEIKNDPLLAFDACDELTIEYIKESKANNILVIEDRFGAISLCANVEHITFLSDSFVSHEALKLNAKKNNLNIDSIFNEISKISNFSNFDLVIFKIPKNMTYFEEIITFLSSKINKDTIIVCPVMIKHLPKSVFTILENSYGSVWTSLAKKKARLIFSKLEVTTKEVIEQSPFISKYHVEELANEVSNHSNVFSRLKLDIGTRFLLKNIPKCEGRVLDLGCGNGVIGIAAKLINPTASITFVDESWMAIRSAVLNYKSIVNNDEMLYKWQNCYESNEQDIFDLVLCNPPFHQQNTIGDFIAWQMFNDSLRILKKGGLLRVIGNSHLGYHLKMQKIFGNAKIIETNNKFVIIDSYK